MSNSDYTSGNGDPREILITYATETGNARDAADYIARQCRRIAFQCQVTNIETISLFLLEKKPDLLSENIVIFVVSTTGSGVEPRSMTPLWQNLLRSDLPSDALQDLLFTVFGLGDTGYEKFCWAAKKLSRRMISLGAVEFYERGEGDDQHILGIDGALCPWSCGLLKILLEICSLPPGMEIVAESEVPPPRVKLNSTSQQSLEEQKDPLEADVLSYNGIVKMNNRITSNDWFQDVRHLEIEFDHDMQYDPGDVAIIHPCASPDDVEMLLDILGWSAKADDALEIQTNMFDQSLPEYLPKYANLRTLFTRFLDVNAVPRRCFFQYLRYFSSNSLEKEKLDEFLSPEGADELYDYCYKVRRTILEVLAEFRHVKIPQDYIFDIFPPLRPREFSIASSVKKHPRQIDLCVALVKYKTKLKVPRKGVCTSYISMLRPGMALPIRIKKGFFRLPAKLDVPIICIGPGTGIAPMRSVIEQRIANGAHSNILYFGCRSSSKDHHYSSEWDGYVSQQKLHYRVAFSRDGEKKVYVQDIIREDAEQIWNILGEHKGWVLISGSSNKMPAAVKEAIGQAVEVHSGLSIEKAKKYVHDMVKEGRLIEECWS